MNQKKLLFIALALVLVMTVIIPSTAFAKNNQSQHESAYTDFTGYGFVFLGNFPANNQEGNTIWFYEELVLGWLNNCTWGQLEGAVFSSTHNSVVRVDKKENARGSMQGTFKLSVNEGELFGTFEGRITGNLGDMLAYDISETHIWDTGTWTCTGGTGVFEGIEAWGKWSAELSEDSDFGLAGPLNWSGKYSNPNKWDGQKPGKPEKPWKSDDVKPGKPFKGWKNSD